MVQRLQDGEPRKPIAISIKVSSLAKLFIELKLVFL